MQRGARSVWLLTENGSKWQIDTGGRFCSAALAINSEQGQIQRANIILHLGDGLTRSQTVRTTGMSKPTVWHWRQTKTSRTLWNSACFTTGRTAHQGSSQIRVEIHANESVSYGC